MWQFAASFIWIYMIFFPTILPTKNGGPVSMDTLAIKLEKKKKTAMFKEDCNVQNGKTWRTRSKI